MKKIGLLGSTGSIGLQTLDIIRKMPDKFSITYLSCNSNIELLIEQTIEFKPKLICIRDSTFKNQITQRLKSYDIDILYGDSGLSDLSMYNDIDLAINAIVGSSGMKPTYNIVSLGVDLALANKESMVMAGKLITETASQTNSNIFPIDSEHSAIWQCIVGEEKSDLEKLLLTGSGGPFRKLPLDQFGKITLNEALKHPNWSMGKKISIDSATMMNKGLEVIEACWLFDMDCKKIDIIIHPQSIIHSMVQFVDGSIKAQLGLPNMTIPIQYAMTYPNHISNNVDRLDLSKIRQLTFESPDLEKFPCIGLAYDAQNSGGSYPTVLNIANDIAVHSFINKEIGFLDIYKLLYKSLEAHTAIKTIDLANIEQLYEWTFSYMKEQIKCLH